MKLAPRLALITSGTLALASVFAGGLLLRVEQQQLLTEAKRESRLLARSLQVSVENALRDGQTPDIVELLGRLEDVSSTTDALVFRPGQPPLVSPGAQVTADVDELLHPTLSAEQVVVREAADPDRLIVAVPLQADDGSPMGALVIVRPLGALEADLRDTGLGVAAAVVLFAGITSGVLTLLMRSGVVAPLGRLSAATRSLTDDIHAPVHLGLSGHDELTDVGQGLLELQRQLARSREAEAEARASRDALEHKLLQAGKLIAIGQLAAGVAHEIGSPLQVLVGRARLLTGEAHPPNVRAEAGKIGEQAERITRIVARMRDLVHDTSPPDASCDLEAECGKIVWLLGPEARRRGVELRLVGHGSAPIHADEAQQIALNLLMNALQASPRGGTVAVSVGPSRLEVTDEGPGVPDDVRERIFEPFFSLRVQDGGTGLGLSIVQRLVQRRGGAIRLEARAPTGAAFYLTWPEVKA